VVPSEAIEYTVLVTNEPPATVGAVPNVNKVVLTARGVRPATARLKVCVAFAVCTVLLAHPTSVKRLSSGK
jgi:F0F1-type ATP synthase membrane subunit a